MERMAGVSGGEQEIGWHPRDWTRARSAVWSWVLLTAVALGARLLPAFFIPNAEQDGYSYAEIISRWSALLASGHLQVSDLFGFWLPLFPLVAALANLFVRDPLLAGKIISVLAGVVSCLLVFDISRRLTGRLGFALLAFALMVLSPLHLVYSAACMTDVPHACLVMASVWAAIQRRWLLAAVLGALAESVRVESWVLFALVPLLQILYERRVSPLVIIVLVLPPLMWLGICQLAAGSPFGFLAERVRYQASYMDFNPSRHGFAWPDIRRDGDYFFMGANLGVMLAAAVAAGVRFRQAVRRRQLPDLGIAALASYLAGLGGFIVLSYVTKRQPVLLPRYGLVFFSLGLPLFVQLIQSALQDPKRWLQSVAAGTLLLCGWDEVRQFPTIGKVRGDFVAHSEIARKLTENMNSDPGARCFCDDVAVRVLSNLPRERFLYSDSRSRAASPTATQFESYLRQNQVRYLVSFATEDSLPAKFYPGLTSSSGEDSTMFELVEQARSPFGPDISLFRVRP